MTRAWTSPLQKRTERRRRASALAADRQPAARGRFPPFLYCGSVSLAAAYRHQTLLVYGALAAASVVAGTLLARNESGAPHALSLLIGLAGLALLLSIPPGALFLGWIAAAPVFADAARASNVGRLGILALYMAPVVPLALLTFTRSDTNRGSLVDVLPAAFVGYVVTSITVTSETSETIFSSLLGSLWLVAGVVALGPLVYYFLGIGPGRTIPRETIAAVLMAGAALQGGLAVLEAVTHRNVWGLNGWQSVSGGGRAVASFANPAVLGMFLGVGIVLAVSALAWGAPRRIRRLAILTLALGVPGLFATLERGPIIATTLGVIVVLLLARRRIVVLFAIASVGLALAALWPSITQTAVYQERATESTNVKLRAGLQDWSLQLASEKPLFGWGYGSFDRIKNTADLTAVGDVPIGQLLKYTSHNSYLTMLVELGAVGLLLYLLPFVVITGRTLARIRAPSEDRWVIGGTAAAMGVIVLTAMTLDVRFFSFAQALPWILLGMIRPRAFDEPPATQR